MIPSDDARSRHAFKNQLAIISGFAEMLLADSADSDPRRYQLEQIQTAATAALDLLARLFPEDHGPDAPPLN